MATWSHLTDIFPRGWNQRATQYFGGRATKIAYANMCPLNMPHNAFFRGNKINTAAERDQRNEDAGKGSDCKHLTFSIPGERIPSVNCFLFEHCLRWASVSPFFENKEVWNVILTGGLEADLSCYSSPRWPRYHLVLDGSFGFGWSR